MSNKYTIEVSITPLCSSCGDELRVGITAGRTPTDPIDRDNPFERADRRVYVHACSRCYVHKSELPAVSEGERHG